jgi:hypothetical protein
MMTQTAPEGEPHFVITMAEHTEMCGQLARAFGNDCFDRLDPFEEVVYVVENHDRGWDGYDANPGIDPVTRLPAIMARTPISDIVKTNVGSPDFNEAHHPYCGLLSSMTQRRALQWPLRLQSICHPHSDDHVAQRSTHVPPAG